MSIQGFRLTSLGRHNAMIKQHRITNLTNLRQIRFTTSKKPRCNVNTTGDCRVSFINFRYVNVIYEGAVTDTFSIKGLLIYRLVVNFLSK